MKDFALFKMKKHFYERMGLPQIHFPVPVDELVRISMTVDIDLPVLLYWLQEYSAHNPDKWLDEEHAMYRLAEILAPEDDRETALVEGDSWSFLLSPVDLSKEIITIQRRDRLLAAMQPLDDGSLKASVYRPLDAKSCSYLVSLGVRPDPEHGVFMRENNWEYALDSSAGMGNMYASEAGEAYLSYWQFGVGITSDKKPVSPWVGMRTLTPLPVNITERQVGVWYVNHKGCL